ncbi:MAG: hypothetical protein H0T51_00670, partial [Pirellulales bacterium]|nr:hypothetical protein [Pirellulales bacterium]
MVADPARASRLPVARLPTGRQAEQQSRRLFRFSQLTLLLLFSVAALALGFARWRRIKTIEAYQQLHDEGVGLVMATGKAPAWLRPIVDEEFLLRRPVKAEIYVSPSGDDYEINGKVMT